MTTMRFHPRPLRPHALALAAAALMAGCGGGGTGDAVDGTAHALAVSGRAVSASGTLPANMREIGSSAYRATTVTPGSAPTSVETQDLLTAGLGQSGLAGAAPSYANPLAPTAAELRRAALYANYRGIADVTAKGGFGVLYGPGLDLDGNATLGEGLVPGVEHLAVIDDASGRKRVTVAVQVPDSFDPARPCIVAGPSSGSRGVYGALGTAAEWGLKRGCAVALTDAGKGMGLYDPTDDTVNKIDGTRATRSAAGALANVVLDLSDAARSAFNALFPNRLALKHAHSQMNPEKDWGADTLDSIRYAFYVLNKTYAPAKNANAALGNRFNPANTLVIAGSVSNGGAAVLRAGELDDEGLIDGVVASEPVTQLASTEGLAVTQGGAAVPVIGRPLADYVTFANIYQPCAALAPEATMAEFSIYNYMTLTAMNARAANRCAALAERGLVTGTTTAEQASDALARLRHFGWSTTTEQNRMHNAHYGLGNAPILAMMYPNAYGRFSVADNLCAMSVAQTAANGDVVAVNPITKAVSFAAGNGTANGAPATPVLNTSVGGAKGWQWAVSPSTGKADFALDAALCQRALYTGTDAVTGAPLTAATTPTLAQSQRVRQGISEVQLNGNLRGKPTLVVQGRSDALVPVNHNSRAYAALNQSVEGAASSLRYVEVTNGQHFDAFLSFSGFDNRFIPLHVYYVEAMNRMWAHLTTGAALPPSQVVRTTPRGGVPGAAPAIMRANVPFIADDAAAGDRITVSTSGGTTTVAVPE